MTWLNRAYVLAWGVVIVALIYYLLAPRQVIVLSDTWKAIVITETQSTWGLDAFGEPFREI
jgi:hypothetical protein